MKLHTLNEKIELTEEEKLKNYLESKWQYRITTYRKLLNLPDDYEITEDNINEWALRHACYLTNCDYNDLRNKLLRKD